MCVHCFYLIFHLILKPVPFMFSNISRWKVRGFSFKNMGEPIVVTNGRLRQWMVSHTGAQVSMYVQSVTDGPFTKIEGLITVDSEGVMCLLMNGQLNRVPCDPFVFASPEVTSVAPIHRSVSPEGRTGSDFANLIAANEQSAKEQRGILRVEAATREAEAKKQREQLLADTQQQAQEAARDRAERAQEAKQEREQLLAGSQLQAQEATRDRAERAQEAKAQREVLLMHVQNTDATASRHREQIRSESAKRDEVAISQREELRMGQEAMRNELREATEDRRALRESLMQIVTTLAQIQNSPELLRSGSTMQPSASSVVSPSFSTPQPFAYVATPFASPEPKLPTGFVGTRSNPMVLSPSNEQTTQLSIADEILLGRERATWTSHAIPTSDIVFGIGEKDLLKRMPEYVFLKEDPNFAAGRRAIRFLTEKIGRHHAIGTTAFFDELAQQLTQHGRALRPHQVAEIQVLTSVTLDPLSFGGVALAEYFILANPLLPATTFDQLRLARITRPQSQAEATSWTTGALMETRLAQFPVRMALNRDTNRTSRPPQRGGMERGRGTDRGRGTPTQAPISKN